MGMKVWDASMHRVPAIRFGSSLFRFGKLIGGKEKHIKRKDGRSQIYRQSPRVCPPLIFRKKKTSCPNGSLEQKLSFFSKILYIYLHHSILYIMCCDPWNQKKTSLMLFGVWVSFWRVFLPQNKGTNRFQVYVYIYIYRSKKVVVILTLTFKIPTLEPMSGVFWVKRARHGQAKPLTSTKATYRELSFWEMMQLRMPLVLSIYLHVWYIYNIYIYRNIMFNAFQLTSR